MATVQATSTAQARTVRATTAWPPPSAPMHTRPWRSSPLAGPAFSTLPPVIPESSEESHENELHESPREHPHTRSSSSSIVSQTGSLSASASGHGSRNASSSASALVLVEGDASASSASLGVSTGAHGTSSSHGHTSSQTHSNPPKRLSKSSRRPSSAQANLAPPKNVSDVSITPPPRARTVSHGHSRPASFPVLPVSSSPTLPQVYSRTSSRPASPKSEANTTKQPPSVSRDPSSNWMSSSPFGPAQTPKFSRLAMASPAVVMPLSAKEYRKQKARESFGIGKQKEPPTSSNRVAFIDNAPSAFQSPNGLPIVKVSPPPSEDVHRPPSSSGDHSSDRRSQPQPQVDHPPSTPLPQTSMSPRPSSPKQKRPRSRPNTPPRSSPLAAHPPISPKSSAGTFFSFASTSDDDADDPNTVNTVPPARPRPRPRRRKSYPDRLSNGRLSLLEAVNRLSQGSASLHRLSSLSQTNEVNRLSVASQASGHTLFYDIVESESEQGQVTGGNANGHADGHAGAHRTPVLHTQSLEDLSTLARTGIEVVDGNSGGPLEDGRKGKRNVRMVRISDTVEVSPPPVPRRRKLTKLRPGSAHRSTPVPGAGPALGPGKAEEVKAQTQTQTQERRGSLLPWKSKGSSNIKAGAVSVGSGVAAAAGERDVSTPTKDRVHLNETTVPTPIPHSISPLANGTAHVEGHSKPIFNGPTKKTPSDPPPTAPSPNPESLPSAPPRKSRRYTFSLLTSSTFHRPKREKSNTAPPSVDLGFDQNIQDKSKGSNKGVESGTDSTSTSIRTITQGSQTTLVPTYDLTTLASSGGLSGSGRGSRSSVPMLRRVTAQEMATDGVPLQSEWEGKGNSTPSLITNGSTASSSSPRTPSFVRLGGGGELFVPRPSGLKESYMDTSEEDSEDAPGGGRTSRMCVHRRQEPSPLARAGAGWGDSSEEDERYLRSGTSPRPGSRPGTASSTLTTATETSGSYLSFSTVPASTVSSSSTSRSASPSSVMGDKRDQVMSVVQGENGDEVVHVCTLCGNQSTSRSPSPMREADLGGIHPMFTVPLVTIPIPALGTYPSSSSNTPSAMQSGGDTGTGGTRYANGRKSQRRTSVSVPAVATPPTRREPNYMHVNANGGPVTTTPTKARTMAVNDKMITTTTMTMLLPSPPPLKMRKQRRPQTAPAGTGDVALKFVEDAKMMRVREGSVDAHVGVDRATKRKDKAGSGESRFKAVLKGLLKWTR